MNDLPPAPRAAPTRRTVLPWLAAVFPLGVGAFLGYQAAYASSLGGLGGALGAAYLAYAIGGLVLLAILVGFGNVLRPAGRGAVASRYAFAAAGMIAAGGFGGAAAVPVLDLGYHPPVVLQARGDASVTLDGVPAIEPSTSGRADCHSVADGTDVAGVSALSLGDLDGNALRAGINLPQPGGSVGHISLFVDAAHLPEGTVAPTWDTDEVEIHASSDGASGSLQFEDAPIRVDPESDAAAASWPASLSGEITWSCGSWFAPDVTGSPTVGAQISLDLAGADWVADPETLGSCEFEADGSVGNLLGDEVGLLQGEPMAMALGLLGDPRAGDEVHLMLSVNIADQSGAWSLPLGAVVAATKGRTIGWTDLVAIEEIADGGRSGRLTFSDLPMETTPDRAWLGSLSGQLSWECG